MRKGLFTFVRFGMVGVLATALHYALYWLLHGLMGANAAFTVAYVLSFVVNFYLTSYFTFGTSPSWRRQSSMRSSWLPRSATAPGSARTPSKVVGKPCSAIAFAALCRLRARE